MDERLRYRLELRRSNAAVPHRNRHREAQTGQAPWEADGFHDLCCAEELCDCEDSDGPPTI